MCNKLRSQLEHELALVQDALINETGSLSVCALEKSGESNASIKYLDGKQQGFKDVIKYLQTHDDQTLSHFLRDEADKYEEKLTTRIGQSANWKPYLEGRLASLARIDELTTG